MVKEPSAAGKRLLALMQDLKWHSWQELEKVASNRFGARLHELRELGYAILDRPNPVHGKEYCLANREPQRRHKRKVKIYATEEAVQQLLSGRITLSLRDAAKRGLDSYLRNTKEEDPFS